MKKIGKLKKKVIKKKKKMKKKEIREKITKKQKENVLWITITQYFVYGRTVISPHHLDIINELKINCTISSPINFFF